MIEDNVWLGTGVIVNPGVTIGRNSVIGAGSLVTKSIPPDVVAADVPSREIRTIESKYRNTFQIPDGMKDLIPLFQQR